MEMQDRLQTAIDIAEQLTGMMTVENEELRHQKIEAVRAQHDRKDAMSRQYEELILSLRLEQGRLKQLDEELCERYRTVAGKLQEISGENERLIKATLTAGRRLMDAIVGAARENRAGGAQTYNAGGRVNTYERPGASNVSLSLDGNF
jgi:membrane protein involved in colicin uptake